MEFATIRNQLAGYVSNVFSGGELGSLDGPTTDPSFCFILRKVLPRLNSLIDEMSKDTALISSFSYIDSPLSSNLRTLYTQIYKFRTRIDIAIGRCEATVFVNKVP